MAEQLDKRNTKCPGCKIPTKDHEWGFPSRFCEGFEKSASPSKKTVIDGDDDDKITEELQNELEALELEEQAIKEKQENILLKRKLEDKRRAVEHLKQQTTQAPAPLVKNVQDLRSINLESPLDQLLQSLPTASTTDPWTSIFNDQTTAPTPAPAMNQAAVFLRPGKLLNGEKALRIVDFLDNLIPLEEEETLSNQGLAQIVVKYGPKKPKLENITISQWVIANTRIFYTLLSEGKLANSNQIQTYLAYTVKIMELTSKYEWKSILMYDDEFRKLQAIYHYPWDFDSHHLHTVLLTPIAKSLHTIGVNKPTNTYNTNNNNRNQFANFTTDGRIICRNCNSTKGCTLHSCNFVHLCNRKVAGKACGEPHAGHYHTNAVKPQQ